MKIFIIYIFIGYLVSLYFIWHYRLSKNSTPKKLDSILALIGPFIWPIQIVWHIKCLLKKKKDEKRKI